MPKDNNEHLSNSQDYSHIKELTKNGRIAMENSKIRAEGGEPMPYIEENIGANNDPVSKKTLAIIGVTGVAALAAAGIYSHYSGDSSNGDTQNTQATPPTHTTPANPNTVVFTNVSAEALIHHKYHDPACKSGGLFGSTTCDASPAPSSEKPDSTEVNTHRFATYRVVGETVCKNSASHKKTRATVAYVMDDTTSPFGSHYIRVTQDVPQVETVINQMHDASEKLVSKPYVKVHEKSQLDTAVATNALKRAATTVCKTYDEKFVSTKLDHQTVYIHRVDAVAYNKAVSHPDSTNEFITASSPQTSSAESTVNNHKKEIAGIIILLGGSLFALRALSKLRQKEEG